MIHKTYISISGASTTGKSTLATALLGGLHQDKFFPVPQLTRREPRPDDNTDLLKCVTNTHFSNEEFFVRYGDYGVLWSDFFNFCASKRQYGVSVNGPREIQHIPKLFTSYPSSIYGRRFNILLRFSHDIDTHKNALSSSLSHKFSNAVASERYRLHDALDRDYYFNQEFVDTNFDLILTRESPIDVWVHDIYKSLQI